jgi:PAS domain S-box-containing protein
MAWQLTPYTLPLAAAALISTGLLVVIYRSREKRGAVPLLGVLLAAVVWSIADGIRLSTTSESLKIIMNDVRFLGPILVTVSVFLFAAEYTNRDHWLTRRRVAALFALHAVTFVLVWTNPYHELVRQGVTMHSEAGFLMMDIDWGPWYYVHAVYSYVLLVAAAGFLASKLRQSGDVETYRGQTLAVLVATIVPWAMNAAFIVGLTQVDLTPFGFTVTGGMLSVATFRYQILDLVPIARSTVVDNIDEGYLVLDTGDTIVDVNDTAVAIIGTDRDSLIGSTFQEVYSDVPTVLEHFEERRDTREQIQLELDGEIRFYDVDVSPIYDRRDRYTGRVVLFRDITEQEERKQQLEARKAKLELQNERLEDFAGIVSHDLRNPINVVKSRIELARMQDDPDDEHFDEMEDGLERMEAIIDDVLTMARQGQTVEETEPVDLATLCEDAWTNVDTRAATLEIETERTVEGDRNRLLQVFENLFRNSVEHGSTSSRPEAGDAIDHGRDDVTIRVGDLGDGFYVEDDGPGIPEDDRDDVLEKGYTTAQDGTGFGLSIVQTAVEAHGWEIAVTEGTDGGARFEITGVGSSVDAEVRAVAQD